MPDAAFVFLNDDACAHWCSRAACKSRDSIIFGESTASGRWKYGLFCELLGVVQQLIEIGLVSTGKRERWR